VNSYRTDDVETIVVAMGSVLGTIKDAVDRRRETGERIGVVGITSFRPFPSETVCDALSAARQVVVIEKAFSIGHGGVLATDVAMATHNTFCSLQSVVAGLGGSPRYEVDLDFCKGCGICVSECPYGVFDVVPERI
jgi:pyruvate ferredoxin oxidoreductase alpha subunit